MTTGYGLELELWGGPLDGRLIKLDVYPEHIDFPIEIFRSLSFQAQISEFLRGECAVPRNHPGLCWHYQWDDDLKKYRYEGRRNR